MHKKMNRYQTSCSLKAFTLAATCACALLVAPQAARADVVLGVDGEYSFPTGEWLEEPGAGLGVQGRLGYNLPLPFVSLGPELQGRYQLFPHDANEADFDYWQVGAGIRAGLGIPGVGIEPSFFVHLGYGALDGAGSDYTIQEDGFVYDVGGALDYTALPFVDFGIHGSYSKLSHSDTSNPSLPTTSQWASIGLHVELNI